MSADEQRHTSGPVAGFPRPIGAGESRPVVEAWLLAARAAALLRGVLAHSGLHRAGAMVISAEVIGGRPVVRVRVKDRADDLARFGLRIARVRSWPAGVALVVDVVDTTTGRIA